ncbi:MAG: 50S ribosomal protein L29 [Elusimicrobiota bacterium]
MKKKQWTEIKEVGLNELQARLTEMKSKLAQLRFSKRTTGLKNPLEIRNLRRDIARIMTLINTKQGSGVKK